MVETLNEEQIAYLNTQRIESANKRLNPHKIIEDIATGAITFGERLPELVRWNSESDWGKTNVDINFGDKSHPVDSYFVSQEELEAGLARLGNQFRKYESETDDKQFTWDMENYSITRVSSNGNVAVGGFVDENGQFSVDFYLSKTVKQKILQAAIVHGIKRVDKKYGEALEIHARYKILRDQLASLTP